MKWQLAIAVVAMIGVNGAALADTPYAGTNREQMAPARATESGDQTICVPSEQRDFPPAGDTIWLVATG